MKVQTKIAALLLTSASLVVSGTAYATVAPEDVPSTSAPADTDRPDLVEAKNKASRFAVVGGGGNLQRGRNAVTASRAGATGQYEVLFDRDITQCAYVATIEANTISSGEISVTPRSGEPNGVLVITRVGGQFLGRSAVSPRRHLLTGHHRFTTRPTWGTGWVACVRAAVTEP